MLPEEKRIKTVELAKTKSPCHKIFELDEAKAAMAGAVVSSNFLLQLSILLKYVFYSKYVFYLNMYFTPRKLQINVVLMVNL